MIGNSIVLPNTMLFAIIDLLAAFTPKLLEKLYYKNGVNMFLRRLILWTIPLCLCVLIAGSFLPTLVGSFAKIYLRIYKGWDVTYASVKWKDQSFVFTDIGVKDKDSFSLSAPALSICIQTKYLTMDRPLVTISQMPLFGSDRSQWQELMARTTRWSCSIENAVFRGEDLPPVSFSIKHCAPQGSGHVYITLDESWISIEKTKGTLVDITCHQFPLAYLNLWTGKQSVGTVQGSIHLQNEGTVWSLLGGSLTGKDVGYEGIAEGICGQLAWDGPINARDWTQIFDQGRLRLSFSQGRLYPL